MSILPLMGTLSQASPAVREWLRLRTVLETEHSDPGEARLLNALERQEHAMSPAERQQAQLHYWQQTHPEMPSATQLVAWSRCPCQECFLERQEGGER